MVPISLEALPPLVGFCFPLDVDLGPTPILNENNSELFSYLNHVSIDADFTVSVLKILIHDRCTARRERHNTDKLICELEVVCQDTSIY